MFGRKKRKPKTKTKDETRPARRGKPSGRSPVWLGRLFKPAVCIGVVVGLIFAARALEKRVLKTAPGRPERFKVMLHNRDEWMPSSLARRIGSEAIPQDADYYDHELARKIHDRLLTDPWIKNVRRVHKRRGRDDSTAVLDIYADYRRPVARVRTERGYVFVDAEGYRLPADEVPRWAVFYEKGSRRSHACYVSKAEVPPAYNPSKLHYIVIDGVTTKPPACGQRWDAPDLAEGLKLVNLVLTRPYANQITVVDVRNHAGRINTDEPFLRMYAHVGQGWPTDIRFGRFPAEDMPDYVVSPQRKMTYLDRYVAEHSGKLAGLHRYLDLRYDQLHVSIN